MRNREDARDCAAEVLLSLARRPTEADLPDHLPRYLAGGSRKQACLLLRSRRALSLRFGFDADASSDRRSQAEVPAPGLSAALRGFLDTLPERERLVLQATAELGSPSAAARVLGISVALANNALHRARAKARTALADLLRGLQPRQRGVAEPSAPRQGRQP